MTSCEVLEAEGIKQQLDGVINGDGADGYDFHLLSFPVLSSVEVIHPMVRSTAATFPTAIGE